jgi:hypothetical protein
MVASYNVARGAVSPSLTTKLEHHLFSVISNCLFNTLAATLHICTEISKVLQETGVGTRISALLPIHKTNHSTTVTCLFLCLFHLYTLDLSNPEPLGPNWSLSRKLSKPRLVNILQHQTPK